MDPKAENITQVTIPIPLPFERNFGVHATTHNSAVRVMQRMTRAQHDEIQKAAAKLGVTFAAFVKESAFNMAKAVNQLSKDKDNAQHNLRSG